MHTQTGTKPNTYEKDKEEGSQLQSQPWIDCVSLNKVHGAKEEGI